MNYKPDESTLMGYLYGELDSREMQQVEDYLSAHPEVRAKLDELNHTRSLLGNLTDQPVEPPTFMLPVSTSGPTQEPWFSGFAKNAAAIAILMAFLMAMGRFTGADLQLGSSGIALSFVEKAVPGPERTDGEELDREAFVKFVETSLRSQQEALVQQQEQWQQEVAENMLLSKNLPDEQLIDQITTKMEGRMDSYFQAIQQENALLLASYWEEVALMQKNYMNVLLDDYADGLQRVREEDLLYLQERLNGLQVKNWQLEHEVSEILTYLLAEMKTPTPSIP